MPDIRDVVLLISLLVFWFVADKALKYGVERLFRAARYRAEESGVIQEGMVQRFTTIRQLITQIARVILSLSMAFWILSLLGLDVRPIVAGIGVVGLGVSLAAQNVIRDFINGMLILIEDQYNVDDCIEVNSIAGVVESFSLRCTRLRNMDGNLIVIPNSLIQTVINYTKFWSSALVKISITYDSDYKKALSLMEDVSNDMFSEPNTLILEKPVVQGIVDFSLNSVDMRVIIKTTPGGQWEVGRNYRKRLKELFDKEGITFASPRVFLDDKR